LQIGTYARSSSIRPYLGSVANLDPGMTFKEAQALARVVTEATQPESQVVPDGDWFAVTVTAAGGTWCLYDEADWLWLKGQIVDGS